MKFTDIIQVFPQALKAIPDAFKTEDLQDLDATLAGLDTQPTAELIKTLKDWFQTHTHARDTAIQFANNKREIAKLAPKPLRSEAEILENLFELRKTNRKTLAGKTNPPPTDSK
jgi:hypothetical protein